LDEVALKIAGVKHWLWRAVDQTGIVLDVLVRSRRDKRVTKRLLRQLLNKPHPAATRHDHRQACQFRPR
jgi:putative transposase